MIRSAIIILCVNYGAFLFSQDLQFSRDFIAMKKNLPVAIINNHSNYFHVLKYNRDVHDLTLERRAKPSAEIVSFTPLKLDSVNATWFNYENMDYIFHEHKHVIYFLFEKVVNSKKEIFIKTIDTNGKASGFKLLAAIEKDNSMNDFQFEYKIVDQTKLLIISSSDHLNGTTKKTAQLIDLVTKEKIWVKKLPIENALTGYSTSYVCNQKGDLYYLILYPELQRFKRKYMDHRQVEIPVYSYPKLEIACFLADNSAIIKNSPAMSSVNSIYNVALTAEEKTISLFLHFTKGEDPSSEKVAFLTQQWSYNLSAEIYHTIQQLSESIDQQLTFYDGTDYKTSADKEFGSIESFRTELDAYELVERKEKNNYKELLFVNWDKQNGRILNQQLIPRRINYFDERSRIKNFGLTNQLATADNYFIVLFENKANENIQAKDYYYKDFSKLKSTKNANLVMYTIQKDGKVCKKVIYQNKGYDYVPLNYQSDQNEFIFYFNKTKSEKFATLKLNQP